MSSEMPQDEKRFAPRPATRRLGGSRWPYWQNGPLTNQQTILLPSGGQGCLTMQSQGGNAWGVVEGI